MDLTRRQTTFMERLVDLYHEAHGPIHYSTLAQRLTSTRMQMLDLFAPPSTAEQFPSSPEAVKKSTQGDF